MMGPATGNAVTDALCTILLFNQSTRSSCVAEAQSQQRLIDLELDIVARGMHEYVQYIAHHPLRCVIPTQGSVIECKGLRGLGGGNWD